MVEIETVEERDLLKIGKRRESLTEIDIQSKARKFDNRKEREVFCL